MVRTRSEAAKTSSSDTTTSTKAPGKVSSKASAGKITRSTVLLDSSITSVVLAGLAFLIGYDYIKLNSVVNTESLSGLGARLEFTLRFLPIGLSWLIFCLVRVSVKRLNSPAINPLAGHEDIVSADVRILQNSLEQYIISVFAQLAIVSQKVSGSEVAKVVCFLNATFIVGRILFFVGYPNRRSCGLVTTALPSYVATVYALAKLIQLVCVPYIY